MGAAVSTLPSLFSRPPATPPPYVQKLDATAATGHDPKVGSSGEAAPMQQRFLPAPGEYVKAGQVGGAVQKEAQIIKEARRKMGVDCINHYNFAVCGQSGVGKSSFINGFLRLKGHNACSIGEVETTQKIQKYSTKQAPYLVIWDIPTDGETINHLGDTYFEDKKLYAFDAVLILFSDCFLAVDFGILRSARKYATPCVFVRTKCDISVHSRAQRDSIDTLTASQRIRRDVKSNFHVSLAEVGLKDITPAPELFFISNNFFLDEDAYSLYDKKTRAMDTSLSSMDELKLTSFMYDIAKIRAPHLKE